MKAGLFYFYGMKNAGDMAINIGALKIINKLGFERINVLSRFELNSSDHIEIEEYIKTYSDFFSDMRLFPGPFSFTRKNGISGFTEYIKVLFKFRSTYCESHIQEFINDSDMFFFNGGNLLRINSIKDFLRLIALFFPVFILKRKHKKIVLLPHSTNNMNGLQKKLLEKFLRNFDYIFSRDKITYDIFNQINLRNCLPQIDVCFFQNLDTLELRRYNPTVRNINITVRDTGIGDIGKLKSSIILELKNRLTEIIHATSINNNNISIKIIVQNKNDIEFSYLIFNEIKEDYTIEVIEEYDVFKLLDIYKVADLVVGMRLHSLIIAASVGTPIIGVFTKEWGIKNPGTFKELGLKSIVVEDREDTIDVNDLISYNIYKKSETNKFIIQKYNEINNSVREIIDECLTSNYSY